MVSVHKRDVMAVAIVTDTQEARFAVQGGGAVLVATELLVAHVQCVCDLHFFKCLAF